MKALVVTLLVASIGPVSAESVPPPGATSCSGCHAVRDTASTPSAIPRIQGRDANEIFSAMVAFDNGTRPATVMNRIAKGFSEDELRAIAAWLAAQK